MRVANLEHPPRPPSLPCWQPVSSPLLAAAVPSLGECELFISKVSQIDFSGCCLVNTVLTEDMFRLFPPVSPCSSASDPVSVSTRAGSNTVTSLVIITSPVSSVSSGNCKFLQSDRSQYCNYSSNSPRQLLSGLFARICKKLRIPMN